MSNRWLGPFLVAVALTLTVWAWTGLPAEVSVPWGDGPVSTLTAALAVPAIMAGVWILLQAFVVVDPLGSETYKRFADTYWLLGNALLLFFLAVHALTLGNALGLAPEADRLIMVGAGILMATVGNYLGRVEPNWFVGLRTPWTLSSDRVWRRTHRAMGRVFFVVGLVLVTLVPVVEVPSVAVAAAGAAIVAVASLVLSYVYWRQEEGGTVGDGGGEGAATRWRAEP